MRYYCHGTFYKPINDNQVLHYSIVDREKNSFLDLTEDETKEFLKKNKVRNLNLLNGKIVTSNMDFLNNEQVKKNIYNLLESATIEFFNRNYGKLAINNGITGISLNASQYGWSVEHNLIYLRTVIHNSYNKTPVVYLGLRFHMDDMSYSGVIDTCSWYWVEDSRPSWETFYTTSKKMYSTRKYKNIETVLERLTESLKVTDITSLKPERE